MFRVKESEGTQGFSWATRVVLFTLVLALLANLGVTYLVLQEHRLLDTLQDGTGPMPATTRATLQTKGRIQLVIALALTALLMIGIGAFLWLRQRYLVNQQSLHQVKMLAHNILASIDRGVITTNREGGITSINSAGIHLLNVNFECVGRPLACISSGEVPLVDVSRKVTEGREVVRDCDFTVHRVGRVLRLRSDGHVLKDHLGTAPTAR